MSLPLSHTNSGIPYFWISSESGLDLVSARINNVACIGIDTEFVWERTYFPQVSLIQLGADNSENFIVDVPQLKNLNGLAAIMKNPKITKILHDAEQDLIIISRIANCQPKNVFDTRRAAGFAGMSPRESLQTLAGEIRQVHLPKTETRTNWLARPLSDRQIEYALNDVIHLPGIRECLLNAITTPENRQWLAEDMAAIENPEIYRDTDDYPSYRKIKGAGKLTAVELSVLKELSTWRERVAKAKDRPRQWILRDRQLIEIASLAPSSAAELGTAAHRNKKTLQNHSAGILKAVQRGLSNARHLNGRKGNTVPRRRVAKQTLDEIMKRIIRKCDKCKIDVGVVISRAQLKSLLSGSNYCPPLLNGWRREFLHGILPDCNGVDSIRK